MPKSLTLAQSATNFGLEGPTAADCIDGVAGNASGDFSGNNIVEGAVPVRTLGLPDDFAFDGWGRRIRYGVSTPYTATKAFAAYALNAPCGASIRVKDAAGSFRTREAVYALVSHGRLGSV